MNTLYEYYKSIGKPLPSVDERRKDNNLGPDYVGTATQNATLLAKLKAPPVTTPPVAPSSVPSPYTFGQDVKDASGKSVGKALYDTNTGKPLSVGDIYKDVQSDDEKEYSRVERSLRKKADEEVDEEDIYQKNLDRFQKEIDAVNQIYAQKLRGQKDITKGNLGTTTAIAARAGALGSPIGEAQYKDVEQQSKEQEGLVMAEQAAKINAILGLGRASAANEIAEKRAAKEAGTKDYLTFLGEKQVRKQTKLSGLAKKLLADGIDVNTLDATQLSEIAKSYGVSEKDIIDSYTTTKETTDAEKAKAESEAMKDKYKTVSEGQTLIDPVTGEIIYQAPKTYAPKSGGGTGGGTGGISTAAQDIIRQINLGADINDLIKGSSIPSQNLRNEVYAGLNAQGGVSTKNLDILKEGKSVVDKLLSTEGYKALGGYSTRAGGQFTQKYGDAKARAQQLASILARDNLGLLKGAMSDKDLAFIQSMSSGFEGEGVQSEQYVQDRLLEIQTKLDNKINAAAPSFINTEVSNEDDSLLGNYGL